MFYCPCHVCAAHCLLRIQHEKAAGDLWHGGGDQLPGGVCATGDHLPQNSEEN